LRIDPNVRTADFDYSLPEELIAQFPVPERDQSRLLVLDRKTGAVAHRRFPELLEYLRAGDLLVLNNSRVIPARLRGVKSSSGGQFEILLVRQNQRNDWWVLLRPGKRVRTGTRLDFRTLQGEASGVSAVVLEKNPEGHCRLLFQGTEDILLRLDELGEIPLPPYINRSAGMGALNDRERYQTVYADQAGSVAAPTAGLHFTPRILEALRDQGVQVRYVTLHVGLGTFAPVKTDQIEEHIMHEEQFELSEETARAITGTKQRQGRIVAAGTTTVRVLESAAHPESQELKATQGRTRIFIHPPCQFKVVDALLTNFHLPQSTLLMLVSAFAAPGETRGRNLVLAAYAEAIRERYRFFSYGDAMLIL
jgi:S-adenosylmethionine:tRNA ribosyltransferase-isomerase